MCIFSDAQLVDRVESSFARKGFTLLRARNGMHGFWLAVTSRPEAIVTDVPQPEMESDYLLDCLRKNPKTQNIPVIVLIEATQQAMPTASCIRRADTCLLKQTSPERISEEVDRCIAPTERPASSTDVNQRFSRFDDYFATLDQGQHVCRPPFSSSPQAQPAKRPCASVAVANTRG